MFQLSLEERQLIANYVLLYRKKDPFEQFRKLHTFSVSLSAGYIIMPVGVSDYF